MRDNPIDYNLEIKETNTMGLGLFTTKEIKKDDYICPYTYDPTEKYSLKDFKLKYGNDYLHTYKVQRHNYIISVKDNRNIITYINENKNNPNVYLKSFKLYANQDISKGSQLFLKYFYNTNF